MNKYSTFLTDNVRQLLINRLYKDQLDYWNDRLQLLAYRNAIAQGYDQPMPVEITLQTPLGGITYLGTTWCKVQLDWSSYVGELRFCYPLKSEDPELASEMQDIVTELQAIKREKYEAERFLSGLFMFDIDGTKLKEILGPNLGNLACHTTREPLMPAVFVENEATLHALNTYLENHRHVIEHMNERMVFNLITQESLT